MPHNNLSEKQKLSRNLRIITIVFVSVIALVLIAGTLFAFILMGKMGFTPSGIIEKLTASEEKQAGDELETNDPGLSSLIKELTGVDDLSLLLKAWSDGEVELMDDEKVINVLLLGIDKQGSDTYGRTDTMMLLSLNRLTKKITLSSFYRDSYIYMRVGLEPRFAKLNAAFVYGGASGLINTLEANYKLDIHYYVSIDIDAFVEVIDAVGGVSVPMSENDAKSMNLQPGNSFTAGDAVLLNGSQALFYSRVRILDDDGDVSRTRRQRAVITALITKLGEAKLSSAADAVNVLLPYVTTDMPKTKILSFAMSALSEKWYAYDISQLQVPSESYRMPYSGAAWVWIVDYPGAASELQNTIYGRTNIQLAEDRNTAIDIAKKIIEKEAAGQ